MEDISLLASNTYTIAFRSRTLHNVDGRVIRFINGDYTAGYNTIQRIKWMLNGATGE